MPLKVTQKQLLRLPRLVGELEGKPLKANFGRFGPYVQWDKTFASLTAPLTPLNVTEAEAIELVRAKVIAAEASLMHTYSTPQGAVELRKGRYGPYLKWDKENVKIPRGIEPEKLTTEEVIELIAKHVPSAGKGKGRGRPGAKTKSAAKPKAKSAAKPKAKKAPATNK